MKRINAESTHTLHSNSTIFFCLWLCFCCCFSLSAAYTGIIPPSPESNGKCIYRGDTLKLGVNLGIAPCQRLTCLDDGSIEIEGCGKLRIENCNRGERINPQKPYPECCVWKYKCKKSDGTPFYIERNSSSKAENST